LVDNFSTEEDKVWENEFLLKNTIVIRSKENLGFSGGCNLAISDAVLKNFKYILLLNNDTTVEPNFLTALVSAIEKNSHVGAVSGKIYSHYQRDFVWSAGGAYHRKTGLIEQFSGQDSEIFNHEKEISFATACCMLINRDVVNKVGFLDESYFMYSEDTDYCIRILDKGFKIIYTPNAIIYHKISASLGIRSSIVQKYMIRNNLYLIKKYSSNRGIGYINLSYQMIKHILKGRRNLYPTISGYINFLLNKTGKYGSK
jgi:GT2 family glycosyltransferase